MITWFGTSDAEKLRVARPLVRAAVRAVDRAERAIKRGDHHLIKRNLRNAQLRYAAATRLCDFVWPDLEKRIKALEERG